MSRGKGGKVIITIMAILVQRGQDRNGNQHSAEKGFLNF
jgi:hypothetical protein